jgi:hypothetical protein
MVNKLAKGRLLPSGMLWSLTAVNFIVSITGESLKSDKPDKCVYCIETIDTVHF